MAVPMAAKSFSKPIPPANTNKKPMAKVDIRCADVERVLLELEVDAPGKFHAAPDIGARSGSVFNDVREKPDSLRKAVRRSLLSLEESGKIESGIDGYRVKISQPTECQAD
jgi:hypothetical protein